MLDYRTKTFLTVCKTLNFTTAAKQLNITQPAVHMTEKWCACSAPSVYL